MKTRLLLSAGLCLLVFFASQWGSPVSAAPAAQFTPFPTPTPGPDGRIYYTAQENDSAWRIAAIYDIPLEKLRELNKWGDNPVIKPGDKILLGLGGPASVSPTPGPSLTPAPVKPTGTAAPGWGNLCVIVYNDLNGDSLRQEEEPSVAGGAISISNRSGTVSRTADTLNSTEHQCFEELPEGDYNISIAPPDGYNPTTLTSRALALNAGDITYLDFGAQANAETQAESASLLETAPASGRSPLWGIVGVAFLAAAFGLLLFAGKLTRGR